MTRIERATATSARCCPCGARGAGSARPGRSLTRASSSSFSIRCLWQERSSMSSARGACSRAAHPRRPADGDRRVRHPDTDLAGGLRDVDRRDPLESLLVLVRVEQLDIPSHQAPPHLAREVNWAARGPRSGNRNSDRRARGNSARPFWWGPGARLTHGLNGQGSVSVAGCPRPLSRPVLASDQRPVMRSISSLRAVSIST